MTHRHLLVLVLGAAMACASASSSTTTTGSDATSSAASASTSGAISASASGASTGAPSTLQSRASVQPQCATPDDSTGTSISGIFASPPERLYAAGSATLGELGYAVLEHAPPREMVTAPSYTWPKGTESEGWHGSEHPGVELFLYTRPAGRDSTQVTIGARALCKVRGPGETTPSATVGTSLESVSMIAAMNAFLARLQRAP